ncbi:hypothetical protein KVG95_21040 [Pseudomonas sp. SWRI79]|uniref:Uncharacterized protein n=1 Tax=Pseudomonas farris TaxID=2841207 RepID=A0ABS6PZD4_9PSED|nr:hypothetical protein [Pseudomonas farris]MBV4465816.1 hypothetical protein [Pseudomonas farris]
MGELETLKSMLVELDKSKSTFARQAKEFELLQVEVSALENSADFDPAARKKLQKLNEFMARDGNQSQRQIVEKFAISEMSLKKLGEQLRSLSLAHNEAAGNGVPTPKNNALKKFNRAFV